ncbi:hypothetical protein PF003_g6629 [Phytophthora fragariae]|nr:hypothetical protein PF003_g6629 [Phytophthora fragariae]
MATFTFYIINIISNLLAVVNATEGDVAAVNFMALITWTRWRSSRHTSSCKVTA